MTTTNATTQVETNKAIIKRYFKAYNTKNEAIFDDIIAPDYVDHGQAAYMGSPGRGIAGAKNDLKNSLDKLDDLNYVLEAMIASEWYPYWKGSLTPKASPPNTMHNAGQLDVFGVGEHRELLQWSFNGTTWTGPVSLDPGTWRSDVD